MQFQVLLKPAPVDVQDLYLKSLAEIGVHEAEHDIRFVEDDWESPTLGAWGLGWEVWCDGMEVSQFTYFQQMGSVTCDPVSVELTYGLERLAMYIQNKESIFDIVYAPNVTYGELFLDSEKEFSQYYFEEADVSFLTSAFEVCERECRKLIDRGLIMPAYEQCIQASHLLNMLEARGVISVLQRQDYISRVRALAKICALCHTQSQLSEEEQ